jgi:hypothetical protein
MHVFVLTYNEAELFTYVYNNEFVNQHCIPNDINFIVLDNGNQPLMKEWCDRYDYVYYGSEYNIGSSGGYNWMFKAAYMMGLDSAIIMQSDVDMNSVEPLIFTDKLTKKFGDTTFICWPQELENHWIKDNTQHKPYEHNLPNLGNLVGFKPHVLKEKNCYFDENFVLTHFDDVEFVEWIIRNNIMKITNAAYFLPTTSQQFYDDYDVYHGMKNYSHNRKTFQIDANSFILRIHHASIEIDNRLNGIQNSHGPWYAFNKPYYDSFNLRNFQREPYDSTRWTRFGYPKYPVDHELTRFTRLYPHLIVNHIPMSII